MLKALEDFRELRSLVGTYLESSDDAPRATRLLDTLAAQLFETVTLTAIDEALADKSPRDVAMYAMETLAHAQELIERAQYVLTRLKGAGAGGVSAS